MNTRPRQSGPLLEILGLTKRFGGVAACEDVSLSVREGETVGLIGPNGAGKTTLFDCIAGLHRIDEGEIWFDGMRIDNVPPDRTNAVGLARTFQAMRVFSHMTVRDNVMVGALGRTRTVKRARERAEELLEYVGIWDKRESFANELSTGQRKRLELARALATDPRVLLLDEVTGGVDPRGIPELIALIARLRTTGLTVLIVEHNMRVVTALSERIVALHLGRVIADGPQRDVVSDQGVIEAYLGKSYA